MEPFKIHILGCGSALPTLRHHTSSQVIEMRGKLMMVDCGEGTQVQLRRLRISFTRIQSVFISHLHGDHCFGLMGLISTFGMLGRTSPLHVYAPGEYGPMLRSQMEMFCPGLEYEVVFHAVDTTQSQVIYEDKSLTVTTLPLEHRVACCGFLFREKPTLPHIRRDMIDFYHIPVCHINNIKNGLDWVTPEGEVIPHERLTVAAEKPRAYAYCSDTRYMPSLHRLVEGVDVLYHESTYASAQEDRARLFYHSTVRQAALVARDAHAGRLVLGHYSSRYDDETVLLREAQAVFPHTSLAQEGMVIQV